MERGWKNEGGLAPNGVALLEKKIGDMQGMASRGAARPTEAMEILRMVRVELCGLRQIIKNETTGPEGPRAA
jgi:hypothetical protein